jgi:hypothetical protein
MGAPGRPRPLRIGIGGAGHRVATAVMTEPGRCLSTTIACDRMLSPGDPNSGTAGVRDGRNRR